MTLIKTVKKRRICLLSKVLGYESPWGCMTGIRPAVANTLYERNHTTEDIENTLKSSTDSMTR